MKNNKGFTLIELMIAIAIIGILALVLIPKVSGLKTQAKLAGLDTNMRIALAAAEGMINDYDDTTVHILESDLANKLGTGTNLVKNPITGKTGVASGAIPAAGAAFQYDADAGADDAAKAAAEAADATTSYADETTMAGVIRYDASYVGSVLQIKFVPYDDKGKPMTTKIKTVTK